MWTIQLEPVTYHDDQTKEVKTGRIIFTCLVDEKYTEFWMENLDERDHMEDIGLDGKVILKFIFKKEGTRM